MDRKTVPIGKETVLDRQAATRLGPVTLDLPEGPALCSDARSLTITVNEYGTGEKFVLIIAVAEHDGRRLGSLSAMTPDQARQFAASLLASADMIAPFTGVN